MIPPSQTKTSDKMKMMNVMDKWYNDIEYTFTINPCDSLQYFGKGRRTHKCYEGVIKLISPLKKYATYTLYPEYSQPECRTEGYSGPRMHYHGTIKFHDLFGFLELGYYKLTRWCMFEIDSIAHPEHWQRYIKKQQSIWSSKYEITNNTKDYIKDPLRKTKKDVMSYYAQTSTLSD